MIEITVEGPRVRIDGVPCEFEYEVDDVLVVDETVVVLLDVPTGETDNRNVVGLNLDGSRRWRIDALDSERADKPFVAIDGEDGDFVADNWIGVRATVDPATGAITDTILTK